MAARTRGRVAGSWLDGRAILRRSGSNWIPANGYVKQNGVWVPLAPHTIYRVGYEVYSMAGESGGAHHGASKTGEYLHMWGIGTIFLGSWGQFTGQVDLTHFSQLIVYWRNRGHHLPGVKSKLQVIVPDGTVAAEYVRTGNFGWRYDTLDVSGFAGSWRVRVHAYTSANNESTLLDVSRLYLW